jgi:hypothetical protein
MIPKRCPLARTLDLSLRPAAPRWSPWWPCRRPAWTVPGSAASGATRPYRWSEAVSLPAAFAGRAKPRRPPYRLETFWLAIRRKRTHQRQIALLDLIVASILADAENREGVIHEAICRLSRLRCRQCLLRVREASSPATWPPAATCGSSRQGPRPPGFARASLSCVLPCPAVYPPD